MKKASEIYEDFFDDAVDHLLYAGSFGELIDCSRKVKGFNSLVLLARNSEGARAVLREEVRVLVDVIREDVEEDEGTFEDTDKLMFATLLVLVDAQDPGVNTLSRDVRSVASASWSQMLLSSHLLNEELGRHE